MAMHLPTPPTPASVGREPDGVVVFGGVDWWYHNRGHYDLRMACRFARRVPTIYVNSIGMRVPAAREGRMFARRIVRKCRSLRRGLVAVDPWTGRTLDRPATRGAAQLRVLTLPWLPGDGAAARLGRRVAGPWSARTLAAALDACGIEHPLAWVACPTAWPLLDAIRPVGLVYQRTDRYEDFPGVDRAAVGILDRRLKQRADLTVFCAKVLLESEGPRCRRAALVDHGVDLARFDAARAAGDAGVPGELAAIGHPRAGFVGALDAHTFDPELFTAVVRRLPDVRFVLVGASTLPDAVFEHPNVHRLGQRDPAEVARFMTACDVLVMPWRRSAWIDACHPVKTREYLAADRPVVTAPFAEARRYGDLLAVAESPDDFAAAIRRAIDAPPPAGSRRAAVEGCDWNDRFAEVLAELAAIEPRQGGPIRLRTAPGTGDRPEAQGRTMPDASHRPPPPADRPLADRTIEVTPAPRLAPASRPADRIAAVFLMAGGLEPSPIERLAKRSVLDLPIVPADEEDAAGRSAPARLVDLWIDAIARIGASRAPEVAEPLPVRIVAGAARPAPWPALTHPERIAAAAPHLRIRFERDPAAFRGMIGVLRDLGRGLDPDDHVLVLEAGRLPQADLDALVGGHLASGADVTAAVVASRTPAAPAVADGLAAIAEPAGAWVLRAGTLAFAPPAGWCDLKEQWLPRVIDAGGLVRAAELPPPGMPPIRDEASLLDAIRLERARRERPDLSPGAIAGLPVRIIEPGARVAPSALVNDAVILAGATIAGGAVVADTVVGPTARGRRGGDRRLFRRTAA